MTEMMTQPVVVRGVPIGAGIPKICVPIVAGTIGAASSQAGRLASLTQPHPPDGERIVDMVEWRADWMEGVADGIGLPAAQSIRAVMPDIPILFTFRTQREGGEQAISKEGYLKLVCDMTESGLFDLIDLELSAGSDAVRQMIEIAHDKGVKVLVSNHDFHGTPSVQEMVSRLTRMESIGADILKIAVMPQEPRDVLKLLSATAEMYKRTSCPVVTMSMSPMGTVSRLCGEVFGSAITFGSLDQASAPGQIGAAQLRQFLKVLQL